MLATHTTYINYNGACSLPQKLMPQPWVFSRIANAPVLYLGGTRFESGPGRAWYLSWQIYVALKEVIGIRRLCHTCMFLKYGCDGDMSVCVLIN